MAARVPLDVDLEDRLLYGLTPIRLAYLVVGLLGAFSIWSTHWAPVAVRGTAAAVVILIAMVAAWGRWRGRPADRWAIDGALFVLVNYHVEWSRKRK